MILNLILFKGILDFRGKFMKYYYRVYGLNIESTIEIPEFEVIDDISKYSIDVNLTYELLTVK